MTYRNIGTNISQSHLSQLITGDELQNIIMEKCNFCCLLCPKTKVTKNLIEIFYE